MIETVKGKIKQADLGITMCHEHFIIDLRKVRQDEDSALQDMGIMLHEMQQLKHLGCNAVVEVTGNDMGRDVVKLKELSEASGIHVVASTGFYLEPYHTQWIDEATEDEIKNLFIKEITEGIEDTAIKAGIIAEVASSKNQIYPNEKKVLRAAAKASAEINCAVSTHCDMGTMGKEQAQLMLGLGMDPDKLILGHTDLINKCSYHLELLKKGINIAFDTIGKTSYLTDEKRADNLVILLEKGYEDHILLSQDISRKSYLSSCGGQGYTAVLGGFINLLKERQVSEKQIEKMLIYNPARILDR